MKEITMNIPFTLDQRFIDNITVSAIEGGIGYWACITNIDTDNMSDEDKSLYENRKNPEASYGEYICLSELISRGAVLTIEDEEEEKTYKLDLDGVIEGFKKYILEADHCLSKDVNYYLENGFDCEESDAVIQCAIFGDIIYS